MTPRRGRDSQPVVLVNPEGRRLDLHPIVIDEHGNGWQHLGNSRRGSDARVVVDRSDGPAAEVETKIRLRSVRLSHVRARRPRQGDYRIAPRLDMGRTRSSPEHVPEGRKGATAPFGVPPLGIEPRTFGLRDAYFQVFFCECSRLSGQIDRARCP
jgi:hypothetical protein